MTTITKENINHITGVLKRFFRANPCGVITWHNFRRTSKRRTTPLVIDGKRLSPSYFPDVTLEVIELGDVVEFHVKFDENNSMFIALGDRIRLQSGKITHCGEWDLRISGDQSRYIYTVIQACPNPTVDQQTEYEERSAWQSAAAFDDEPGWYDEF